MEITNCHANELFFTTIMLMNLLFGQTKNRNSSEDLVALCSLHSHGSEKGC
jgi:hypothetical protein